MGKIIFTNGCFDLLHIGHIQLLRKAKELGETLAIGLNSDKSIRQIKGDHRPITPQQQRYEILKSLKYVNVVMLFDEPDPLRLIKMINPDVLVKGGDWNEDDIIGADFVMNNGGTVVTIPLIQNVSTTNIINRIKDL